MALITPANAGRTARDVVAARLTRRDRDVPGIVMLWIVFGMRVGNEASGCVHKRNLKLNIRAKFSSEKRHF